MNHPATLWRCPCGAVLTAKSVVRHTAGETMCQHRGKGVQVYTQVPPKLKPFTVPSK